MRAVVTRVSSASVSIDGATVGAIGTGFLVLLGIGPNDTQAQAEKLADKICGLRVFADEAGPHPRRWPFPCMRPFWTCDGPGASRWSTGRSARTWRCSR